MEPNYTIKELAEDEFFPLFDRHRQFVFEDVHSYSPKDLLTSVELQRTENLGQGTSSSPYKLFLAVFNGKDEFVGWSWGEQENSSTFYMINSAVLPDHRRRDFIARCSPDA